MFDRNIVLTSHSILILFVVDDDILTKCFNGIEAKADLQKHEQHRGTSTPKHAKPPRKSPGSLLHALPKSTVHNRISCSHRSVQHATNAGNRSLPVDLPKLFHAHDVRNLASSASSNRRSNGHARGRRRVIWRMRSMPLDRVWQMLRMPHHAQLRL